MSELDLNTNHRILPAELCGPAPLADRYRQRGYWQPETLAQLIMQWQQHGECTALIEPGRSWSSLRGYYRTPEHNRNAFTTEDFFSSGDRVRLRVEGRTRDMINRSGESFAADEIEECLRAHSLIHEVSVLVDAVGEQQETIHAIVVARSSHVG
ncbi:hypothetical protein [Serratia symbiotica]|uniref:hypothetical protein n=1 Tax=Serratia symbiotica TaxID=138074 RepID=UPI0002F776BF|nr:hypothetical protein [Serratia symbiotica]